MFIRVTKVVWRKIEGTWTESPLWLAADTIQNFEHYNFRGDRAAESAAHFPVTRIRLRKPLQDDDDARHEGGRRPALWLTIASRPEDLAAQLGVY